MVNYLKTMTENETELFRVNGSSLKFKYVPEYLKELFGKVPKQSRAGAMWTHGPSCLGISHFLPLIRC